MTAGNYYSVVANMRGDSAEEVAGAILGHDGLRGLQASPASASQRPSPNPAVDSVAWAPEVIWSRARRQCSWCRWAWHQQMLYAQTAGSLHTVMEHDMDRF